MKSYPSLCFTVGHDYKFIYPADISHVSSEGSYTHCHIIDGTKFTLSKNLKEIESILPTDIFVRVHHSYIVNLIFVDKFYAQDPPHLELTNGTSVPISRRKKQNFLEKYVKL